jgi:hypothetical protein
LGIILPLKLILNEKIGKAFPLWYYPARGGHKRLNTISKKLKSLVIKSFKGIKETSVTLAPPLSTQRNSFLTPVTPFL